jgi:Ca2+-binding EF-hand superfamily protein
MPFTEDQLEEWKDYWTLFDVEGKGTIAYSMIGTAIRSFGWAPTNIQVESALGNPSKDDMATKNISFEEFVPILEKVSEMPPTGTREDFFEGLKVFDKEANGFVQAAEIQHVLGALGEKLNKDEIAQIWKPIDGEINANGAIKLETFLNHIMTDPADE